MKNQTISRVIIQIGTRLNLIKEADKITVCNFTNNYYGDQQCCSVGQLRLKKK